MRRFALTVTSKGQVTLPAEYRRLIGAEPGHRLELLVDEAGEARVRRKHSDLSELKNIARRARKSGKKDAVKKDDPIARLLIAQDERSKSSRAR